MNHWNLAAAIGDRSHPVVIEFERGGIVATTALLQQSPILSFQAPKLRGLLLALVCWATGYLLGIIRRQDMGGSTIVSVFWLLTAAVFGMYLFGRYLSLPVLMIVQWLACTVLAPLAVYCHVIFPPRLVAKKTKRTWRRGLVSVSLVLNTALVGWMTLMSPTLLQLTATLSSLLIVSVCLSSLLSGVLLLHAYRRVTLAHTRRQIRLMLVACFVVAVAWGYLDMLLQVLEGDTRLSDYIADLVLGFVPVAYLASGVIPDLYRLDRLAVRMGALLLAGSLIALLFLSVSALLAPVSPTIAVLIALLAAVLYRPFYHFFLRLFPSDWILGRNYRALRQAASKLTTTLDASAIAAIVHEGIDQAFQSPACAIYLADNERDVAVTVARCAGFPHVPTTIPGSELTMMFGGARHIRNARELHAQINQQLLHVPVLEALVHTSTIVLCVPFVHTQGHILGVVLLGHSGNLDPYRVRDIHELRQMFDAASLALTNVWTYRQRCIAEETVRQMFGALQDAQETTAAAIAREIHDEVINVTMRLNIKALERLLDASDDPAMRDELHLLVESEQWGEKDGS